ncbi:hypothetical protein CEQ90_12115 [Lewinellaceae bacterium SD302]|nr:hypothetical protein CEQ90_12115 [Lewinellaceae bacterium SD302]
MKYLSISLLAVFLFAGCTSQQIRDTLSTFLDTPLTTEEVANGLKEALNRGSQKGASALAQEGGYFNDLAYRILLPEEAQKVTDRLKIIPGFTDLEEVVIRKINQGAEDAAKEAAPIFLNAIKSMTIQDAFSILQGDKDAATQYLIRSTRNELFSRFNPVIVNSLDKFQARKVWSDATTKYNAIPFVDDVDTDLAGYVTNQALDGLFKKVALEELNIRNNINARTTDLLKKVFGAQDAE